ncbi:HIRA-interacting protein 5 [Candidatus Terasakiella magnetica]|uniref:HIRA-interacting protein 5 n=1 Tax=Candidatus Terasakiella magnetica TaxID=1867952 RepID=A0A1C3RIZ3_9PROT|nr:NifU family protein [Candidatus Terasakiella magnetica]SCA57228.1 HIRA-interacting protein 5 [Candidatus Terasakiella magnetica]
MFIQTEATPNPSTLKFIPEQTIMAQGTANFNDKDTAARSPLATRLFDVEGVDSIFLGSDFITVTKEDDKEWQVLKPMVLEALMNHFNSGDAVVKEEAASTEDAAEDDDIVKQIKELLETRVRPAVAQDGGDIIFHKYEDGIVYLTMMGACSGCPSSGATLKHGIENMLRYYIPEIQEVRQAE